MIKSKKSSYFKGLKAKERELEAALALQNNTLIHTGAPTLQLRHNNSGYVDAFFRCVQPRAIMLDKDWFVSKLAVLPSFTLNAFLAYTGSMCRPKPGQKDLVIDGEAFYKAAHRELASALATPNLYTCLAMDKPDFLMYTTLSINMVEAIGGFDELTRIPKGRYTPVEMEIIRRMAMFHYEIDKYNSVVSGLPIFREKLPAIQLPWAHFYEHQGTPESLWHLDLQSARLRILYALGQVVSLNFRRTNNIVPPHLYLEDVGFIDNLIMSWFATLTEPLRKRYERYTPQFTATTGACDLIYVHCLPHYARILLHQPVYKSNLDPLAVSRSYTISCESALAITESAQVLLRDDPFADNVLPFLANIIATAASVISDMYHRDRHLELVEKYSMLMTSVRNMSYNWSWAKLIHQQMIGVYSKLT